MRFRSVMVTFPLAASGVFAFAGMVSACSDDTSPRAAASDGGSDAAPPPAVVTNDTETKQAGRVIRTQTDDGVVGATVTIAGKSATAGANGAYEIIVPRNTPYQMCVRADGYYSLLEQEWIVKKPELDWGSSNLLPTATADLLLSLLPERKKEKGLLLVKVNALPPCTTEEGSTLILDPPGEAKLRYFSGFVPDSTLTATKGGATFSAIFYNVEIGVPLTVTANSPGCAQAAFPIDIGDVTYTGVQKAEPGDALAYVRLYLRDAKPADAGTD